MRWVTILDFAAAGLDVAVGVIYAMQGTAWCALYFALATVLFGLGIASAIDNRR